MVALAKGLELVWRNENQSKRNIPEWSVETILKIVPSTLNTHWSQEYIFKQTQEFKELGFLKVITQYLKIDTLAHKKIEALYKHLINKEMNRIEVNCVRNEKIIDLKQFKQNKTNKNNFRNNMVDYLESIYFEKHFILFGEILKNKYRLVLTDFFDNEEINRLVESV
ncbi:MAG: hypothetical protein H0U57_11620 [Tatlockia sp.]|nr:hypothetical protein [Tatlockia sp.]